MIIDILLLDLCHDTLYIHVYQLSFPMHWFTNAKENKNGVCVGSIFHRAVWKILNLFTAGSGHELFLATILTGPEEEYAGGLKLMGLARNHRKNEVK